MNSFNKFIFSGRVGNSEMRYTPGGVAITSFSVAVSKSRKNKEGEYEDSTLWIECKAFGKSAEYIESKIDKGDLVLVDGQLSDGTYTNKEGTKVTKYEVLTDSITVLVKKNKKPSEAIDEPAEEAPPF